MLLLASIPALQAAEKLKALIVDGQNNHQVWPKSTVMMKQYLEDTGLFEVDVARTKFIWSAEREAANWQEETQKAFEKYVAVGGEYVSVHAANNSWGDRKEFNQMIALGGWGDRNEKDGPYVYYNY